MSLGIILLIIGSALVVFVALILILKKVTTPKFPKRDYFEKKKTNENMQVSQGLSFDDSYISENPEYAEQVVDEKDVLDSFDKYQKMFSPRREKTLIEQINELSPEMKMLLLDRGLARKDFEIKSKKN